MADNQLILHPAATAATVDDTGRLLRRLEQIGFLDAPLMFGQEHHYRPGPRFLQLITFLGCSPVVALGEPGATGDEFCHIQLDGPSPRPRFVAGSNVKPPRCPGCGQRAENWMELVERWQDAPQQSWRCPQCGRESLIPALRWRQCAGFGRLFLRVWGVFEGEAVPSEELLTALREASGFDWQYFYYRKDA